MLSTPLLAASFPGAVYCFSLRRVVNKGCNLQHLLRLSMLAGTLMLQVNLASCWYNLLTQQSLLQV